jgi:trans-2-enoyl-CoA reductase
LAEATYLKTPSKDELSAEFDKIRALYIAYCFIYDNAEDDKMRNQIEELARTHIKIKIEAIRYSLAIPMRQRIEELEKKLQEGDFSPPPD